jgi:hypothetical protein
MLKLFTLNRLLSALFAVLLLTSAFAQHKYDNKPYVQGELLVQLEPNVDIYSVVKSIPSEFGIQVVEELSAPMRIWLVKYDSTLFDAVTVQQVLYDHPSITISDYNYYVEMRSTVPNDLQFSQQWHHVNTGQTSGTADADIDTDLAWGITTGGTTATGDEIVVCIIESANLDHDDLRTNRWINPDEIAANGIDDDGNGYVDDVMGWNPGGNNGNVGYGTNSGNTSHGTSCVGMFAAVGDNNLGVVGANWELKVMVVTVASLTQANVISSYTYPLVQRQRWNNTNGAEGALVVATSASWGIDNGNPASYPLWCNFYDTLGHYGIINVGATTNSNLNVDVSGDMPTACSSPYMVGVGRTDHNDNTAGGYGVTTIDFGAPGINVRTTANNNGYTTTTGTSFACPLTAGVVGLAYAIPCEAFINLVKADPKMGADLVLQALLEGVDQKPQLANRFITGGRLNAKNTLDSLMSLSCNLSSCLAPSGIALANLTTNSADISWNQNAEATAYLLNYRPLGSSTWTQETVQGNAYSFTNLAECTTYEYYIGADCDGELSSTSVVATFTTQGCGACLDYTYCQSESNDLAQSLFSVTRPTAIASNFTFQAPTTWGANLQSTYASGELVLVDDGTAGDSLGCNPLINGAAVNGKIAVVYRGSCEFGAKALNAQLAGAIGVIIFNNTSGTIDMAAGTNGASVNIPVAMISNSDGAVLKAQLDSGQLVRGILGTKKDWIQSIAVGSFVHTSGDDNGYAHHISAGTIELNQNSDYTFNFLPGYQTQSYETQFRAWIDYNQNGNFENNELVVAQNTPGYGAHTGSFNVPATALLGSNRMRVVMSYVGPGQLALPAECATFGFGETEDFCVEIKSAEGTNSLTSEESEKLLVYPNPVNDLLSINNGFSEKLYFDLTDLAGRKVKSVVLFAGANELTIGDLSQGTFIYSITNNAGNQVKTGKLQVIK